MRILFRLAIRNILGAGLRTWLNVFVISISLVAIVWNQGFLTGSDEQVTRAMTAAEYGNGQYWEKNYDPFDPLTLDDAHAKPPEALAGLVAEGKATPILIAQGTIYPQGRIRTVLLKGIDPAQKLLSIPSSFLAGETEELPALIGGRMARSTGLNTGDTVTIRWREAAGSFNALDARIVQVMKTIVPTIDNNQVWLPLDRLQAMMKLEGEATLVVLGKEVQPIQGLTDWKFQSLDSLLKDFKDLIKFKSLMRSIVFAILLALGMLAIFDTQVLSIFRRRKEMGTLMALGFTQTRVIQLFTIEGALHGVLAVLLGAIWGLPLLIYFSKQGFAMPQSVDSFGFALGETIYPVYGAGLILGVTILVLLVTTVVSFLPTRKIAKLKPTEALRGKLP